MSDLQTVSFCPMCKRYNGLAYEVTVGVTNSLHRHIRRCAICLHVWETVSWLDES